MENKTGSESRDQCLYLAILLPALIAFMISQTGCSVRYEFGYHGMTGRDDRTLTPEFTSKATKTQERY